MLGTRTARREGWDTGLWAYSVRDARNLLKGARSGTTHRLVIAHPL